MDGMRVCCSKETRKTLFCSDLFHHFGNLEPVTTSDLIGPTRKAMQQLEQGPLAGYMPYTRQTETVLRSLADLKPETLAVMHGIFLPGQMRWPAHWPGGSDQGNLRPLNR
jgi:hypothetical protein